MFNIVVDIFVVTIVVLLLLIISLVNSTSETPKITINSICHGNNGISLIDSTGVYTITNTIIDSTIASWSDAPNISDSTISSSTHIVVSTSIGIDNTTKNSDFQRKNSVVIPVLLLSLIGGLLGLCFIVFFVTLILKRKYKSRSITKGPEFTPCNSPIQR